MTICPPSGLQEVPSKSVAASTFVAAALLGAFVLLKLYALGPVLSDEYIYFYMCRRIAEGAVPYRDFFFAHPPLHLLPGAILAGLFGFSTSLAKVIPSAAAAAAGIAIYRAARRAGPLEGTLALAIFLFSYDLLRTSSHYTGGVEAAALLAWALERAIAGRPAVSGALAGAAALVAFYAMPSAAALGAILVLRRDGSGGRYATWFSLVFLSANALCAAAFGERYWDPVIRYHFLKPVAGDEESAFMLRDVAAENPWLIWAVPAAAITWLTTWRAGEKPPPGANGDTWRITAAGLLSSAAHLAFLAWLGRVYTYYFVLAFPGLAVAGGIAYTRILRALARAAGWRRAAAVAAVLVALAGPLGLRAALRPRGPQTPPTGGGFTYVWREAPLPATLNAAVRAALWEDEAQDSLLMPAITRYLRHESLRFTAPGYLAERVRAMTSEGAALFGDSEITPLVALLTDRPIAGDEADTNYMRFASGITPPDRAIAALENNPPAVVIVAPSRGLYMIPQWRRWIESRYVSTETVHDPLYGPFSLYLRREETAATEDP